MASNSRLTSSAALRRWGPSSHCSYLTRLPTHSRAPRGGCASRMPSRARRPSTTGANVSLSFCLRLPFINDAQVCSTLRCVLYCICASISLANRQAMMREEEEEAGVAMREEEESAPVVSAAPSFRASFAALYESRPLPGDAGSKDFAFDDDFEFVVKDPETRQGLTAEEIFSSRQIRPIYPVFGRAPAAAAAAAAAAAVADEERLESQADEETEAVQGTLLQLLMEDRAEIPGLASSSSSHSASSRMDELEGIPPASYCVWTPSQPASPSPPRCKKSGSTGSSLRLRLRDLVVGRSQSDGKEKFVFLAAEEKKGKESPSRQTKRREAVGKQERIDAGAKGVKAAAPPGMDLVTAHRVFYGKGVPAASGAGRRSFLPYKRDLLGFFANVNGITRTHHPF